MIPRNKLTSSIFRQLRCAATTLHGDWPSTVAVDGPVAGPAVHLIGQYSIQRPIPYRIPHPKPRSMPTNRWAWSLLVLLSLPGSAAFADTDDRMDATLVSLPTAPGTAPVQSPVATLLSVIDTTASADVPAVDAAPPARAPIFIAAFGNALGAEDLEGQRGGADVPAALPVSTMLTNGAVSDNRAIDVITGSNSIRDGAFANASGLPIVIQNTGANVLIQNATIVNVQLR